MSHYEVEIKTIDAKENNMEEIKQMFTDFLEAERKANEAFRENIMQSFSLLAQLMLKNTSDCNVPTFEKETSKGTEISEVKDDIYEEDNKIFEVPDYSGYRTYADSVYKTCHEVLVYAKQYDTRNALLHDVYKALDKEYGVCLWERAREYKRTYGHKPASTLRLMYVLENTIPSYNGLLLGRLNRMLQDVKTSKKASVPFPVTSVSEMRQVGRYLTSVTGCKSTNGASFWRGLYAYMNHHDIDVDWKAETDRLKQINEFKTQDIKTKLDIAEKSDELSAIVISAFNEWIMEAFPEHLNKCI